jgi:DNA-binding NtrC family response regulator
MPQAVVDSDSIFDSGFEKVEPQTLIRDKMCYLPTNREELREIETQMISRCYEECGSNMSETMKKLGYPRSTIYRRLKKLELKSVLVSKKGDSQ